MSNHRYSFSFIISTVIFILLGFSFLLLAQKIEKPKKLTPKVIKIAIISPVIKKVIEKKPLPQKPTVAPIIPIAPKVIKKPKPKKQKRKKIIKKRVIKKDKPKKRVIKKKRVKKRVIKKKIIKKSVVKKKIIKKRVVKPKRVKPKIVKRVAPIIEEVYYSPIPEPKPKPQRVQTPVQPKVTIKPTVKAQPQKVDKSAEKRAFLTQVRGKIVANKKYPKMALRRHIQGAVKVKFDITSNGNVTNIAFINGKTILQKSVRRAIKKSFPISVPNSLKSELPIHDIYITIHFNIN